LLGSTGFGSSQGRTAVITVTGVVNQDYVRSGDYVMRVPLSRLNEGLKRANRLGKVTQVSVN